MPADVCIFGCFEQLSPAAVHTADCWFDSEVKYGSMFHPLSHIYAKTPFCCVKTVANNTLSCQCVVVFDRLWANVTPTLNTAFSLINVHAKGWIHCLLISSTPLLSHATSIYDWLKRVCGVFLVFSWITAEFGWPEHSASFVSVQPSLKSVYHLLIVVSNIVLHQTIYVSIEGIPNRFGMHIHWTLEKIFMHLFFFFIMKKGSP